MPLIVTFAPPSELGNDGVLGIGSARVRETVALGGVSVNAALDGELCFVLSTETDAVLIAHGSAPDASATTRTNATCAGMPIPAGALLPLEVFTGDKISVEAIA